MTHNRAIYKRCFAALSWLAMAACMLVCPTGARGDDALRPADTFDDLNLFGPFAERPNSAIYRKGMGNLIPYLISVVSG